MSGQMLFSPWSWWKPCKPKALNIKTIHRNYIHTLQKYKISFFLEIVSVCKENPSLTLSVRLQKCWVDLRFRSLWRDHGVLRVLLAFLILEVKVSIVSSFLDSVFPIFIIESQLVVFLMVLGLCSFVLVPFPTLLKKLL